MIPLSIASVGARQKMKDSIRSLSSPPGYCFIDEFRHRLSLIKTSLWTAGRRSLSQDSQHEFSDLWIRLRTAVANKARLTSSISCREEEVLACLLLNLRDKDIATALSLSTATIKSHVHGLLAKFGARSRKELAAKVLSASFY